MDINKRKLEIIEGNYINTIMKSTDENIEYTYNIIKSMSDKLTSSNTEITTRMEYNNVLDNSHTYIHLFDNVSHYVGDIHHRHKCYTYGYNIPTRKNNNTITKSSPNSPNPLVRNLEINIKYVYDIYENDIDFKSYLILYYNETTSIIFLDENQTEYFSKKIEKINEYFFKNMTKDVFRLSVELENSLGITMCKNFEILDSI